jgi:hypothetical protein
VHGIAMNRGWCMAVLNPTWFRTPMTNHARFRAVKRDVSR